MTWIALTFFAAAMQSVRTAAQKSLADTISPMAATLVRYLFGLPFALCWFALVAGLDQSASQLHPGVRFFIFASAAAVLQIIATACLVAVLTRRNFAVGTAFAKTEAILTAALGVILFGEHLGLSGWAGVLAGVIGVMTLSAQPGLWRGGARAMVLTPGPSTWLGLGAGLSFALCSLLLREASLSLDGGAFASAGLTLIYMVSLQTVLMVVWISFVERSQWPLIYQRWRLAAFVGLTSVLGSIGWFTAMTLQNAAYVKVLGQVEFLFALAITGRVFREHITQRELAGIALLLISVVLILSAG